MGKSDYSLEGDEVIQEKPKMEGIMVETPNTATPAVLGTFVASLKRSNSKIKDDRATAIAETTELKYRRAVEDIDIKIKDMKRDRENMLDLSPTTTDSLIMASDFNAEQFIQKDIDLGVKIRNAEITLEIAKKQYEYLFVGTPAL